MRPATASDDNRLISEYPETEVENPPLPLVIRHHANGWDSPGVNWLALNPEVGFQLGWQPTDDEWFVWVDGDGTTMIRSLWWQMGLPSHFSEVHETVAAEGWLVLADSRAIAALSAQYGPLSRLRRVTRSAILDDKERYKSSADDLTTQPWPTSG